MEEGRCGGPLAVADGQVRAWVRDANHDRDAPDFDVIFRMQWRRDAMPRWHCIREFSLRLRPYRRNPGTPG